MKKILSLILAALMLTSAAFAADVTVTLTEEENDKIEDLLIKDGAELFNELFDSNFSIKPAEAEIRCIYKSDKIIGFSYILSEYNEYYNETITVTVDTERRDRLGDYIVYYGGGIGYAIYNIEDNTITTYRNAYNKGILTEQILNEMPYVQKVGDLNGDKRIDITDVVRTRDEIVNGYGYEIAPDYAEKTGSYEIGDVGPYDMNCDGRVDILDVTLMRDLIVNG